MKLTNIALKSDPPLKNTYKPLSKPQPEVKIKFDPSFVFDNNINLIHTIPTTQPN